MASLVKNSVLLALIVLGASACKPADRQSSAAGDAGRVATAKTADSELRLDPDRVVAEWSGGKLTYGDLRKKREATFRKLHNKYLQDMYQAEQQELEGFVIETLVQAEAKKAGKTEQEYLAGIAGMPQVSDADVQAFYDQNLKATGQPFEEVKERIRGYLGGSKQRDAVKAEIDRLKAANNVKIDLPPPESSIASFDLEGRPMKGNPNAKVTIVEFSDFECPYCSQAVGGIKALLDAYPNDVKVYFLHYPLNFHQAAMPSAIASQCAHLQGKFWEFHDKLFENQRGLTQELFQSTAKELGLDLEKFNKCVEDPATRAFVQKDMEQGEAAGVEGTPAFYVNGVQSAQGVPTPESIKPIVEKSKS